MKTDTHPNSVWKTLAQTISARTSNRHHWLYLLTAIMAISASIPAYATEPSSPKDSHSMTSSSPSFVSKTLANGLTVIVVPSSTVPLVTIEVAVKNGAFTETPELSGLSHLFEHMFFKSNAAIPNQEAYMKRVRELGISFNGTTSNERVNYFFTLPKDNLKAGLTFMYDAITTVKFDPAEFQREQEVVVGEIDRNEASPGYWFLTALSNALFYKYPNRKDALGSRESVRAATVKMMQTMKDTYYVPNNSALLIAGDVEPEAAFAAAEAQFSTWKKGADPFKKHPVPQHPPLKKDDFVVLTQPVSRPSLVLSWHGPSVNQNPESTYAADVLGTLLRQPESAFQKALVDSGLAYGAGLSYLTQAHVGPISASLTTPPDKLLQALEVLVQELNKMEDPSYFTDEQLAHAKTELNIQKVYDKERTSSYLHDVSFWWSVASLDYFKTYLDKINAVKASDLSAFVKTYIAGKHLVAVLMANDEQTKDFGYSKSFLEEAIKRAKEGVSGASPASKTTEK